MFPKSSQHVLGPKLDTGLVAGSLILADRPGTDHGAVTLNAAVRRVRY